MAKEEWEKVLKISIQGHELILQQGEWSDWIPLRFEFIPFFASVSGNVRFLAKEIQASLIVSAV